MSFVRRKSRLIEREPKEAVQKIAKRYFVACDDTYAPVDYFGFFKFPRIHVEVIGATDNNSHVSHALERIKKFDFEDDDELWLLVDTDHCLESNHYPSFVKPLQEATKLDVNIALSNPCFEWWLLLHHKEPAEIQGLKDAKEVEPCLRKVLGSYNKTRLQKEHYPAAKVVMACKRAKEVDAATNGTHKPTINTSRVYLLWQSIIDSVLPALLPIEFKELYNSGALKNVA